MKRNFCFSPVVTVLLSAALGFTPAFASPAFGAEGVGAAQPADATSTENQQADGIRGPDSEKSSSGQVNVRPAVHASAALPFQLPIADPIGGQLRDYAAAPGKKRAADPSNASGGGCGTQEEQLAVCCAAAGISGLLGADACRRGDLTTALLAGGVFTVLASGVIGGVVGWQYAEAVGMEDTALATQVGAGVGLAGSLLTVGGAMLVLGSGSACMQNCLGCGNTEPTKRPAKKRPKRTRRPRKGRTL